MSKRFSKLGWILMAALLIGALVALPACGGPTGQQEEEEEEPPREGGAWVDEIIISQETSGAASVLKMQEGTVHIYGQGLTDQDVFETVADDPNLEYKLCIGGTRDVMFNVYGPEFPDGMLNPFWSAKIREATQWLLDHDYIVDEVLGGQGIALYTMLQPGGAESARYSDLVESVIEYYSYNPTKAAEVIAEEMANLGATLVDDTWHYNGEPVVVKQLIRIDLAAYPELGDYVADQLESVGKFTVERLYRASADTWGPILLQDPSLRLWNVYGGGWGMPVVYRTQVHSWAQFNTHTVMAGYPPWVQLEPLMMSEEWNDMYNDIIALRYTDFTSMEERADMVENVLTTVRQFANNIWTAAITEFYPYTADIDCVLDLAGALSFQFPYTVHFVDDAGDPVRGGSLSIELPSIMVQPMNPVEGSAMGYDIMVSRDLTGDPDVMPDPQNGLYMPHSFERAEVTIQTGLPVGVSPGSDWCTLSFQDEITVPDSAWADWDAENQVWITAAERALTDAEYEQTAKRKSVVIYPDDIFDKPLHDGSTLSVGDFVMSAIVEFDRGKPESAIFDPAMEADVAEALQRMKGWEITSTDPLTITTWSDVYNLDAEHSLTTWWPQYGTYEEFAPWHTVTLGVLAETDKELAFAGSRAEELGVEWMDYMKGPSLDILKAHLDECVATEYIPYRPTLASYIQPIEREERWANLLNWYEERGHFYVSCGVFYLEQLYPIQKIIVLKAFADYPEPSERYLFMLD